MRETAALLEELGQTDAAKELADIQNTAWTTGSEWRGELGLAVRRINRSVPKEIRERLDRILKASRRP